MAETSSAELRKRNLPGDTAGGGDDAKKEQVTAENSGVSNLIHFSFPWQQKNIF